MLVHLSHAKGLEIEECVVFTELFRGDLVPHQVAPVRRLRGQHVDTGATGIEKASTNLKVRHVGQSARSSVVVVAERHFLNHLLLLEIKHRCRGIIARGHQHGHAGRHINAVDGLVVSALQLRHELHFLPEVRLALRGFVKPVNLDHEVVACDGDAAVVDEPFAACNIGLRRFEIRLKFLKLLQLPAIGVQLIQGQKGPHADCEYIDILR